MSKPCEFCAMNAESVVTVEIENEVLLNVLKKICVELAEQKEQGLLCHKAYSMAQRAIKQFSK